MDTCTAPSHATEENTYRLELTPGYSPFFEGTNGWNMKALEKVLGPFARAQIILNRLSETCFEVIFVRYQHLGHKTERYAGNFRDRFERDKDQGWPFVIAEVKKKPTAVVLEFRRPS